MIDDSLRRLYLSVMQNNRREITQNQDVITILVRDHYNGLGEYVDLTFKFVITAEGLLSHILEEEAW